MDCWTINLQEKKANLSSLDLRDWLWLNHFQIGLTEQIDLKETYLLCEEKKNYSLMQKAWRTDFLMREASHLWKGRRIAGGYIVVMKSPIWKVMDNLKRRLVQKKSCIKNTKTYLNGVLIKRNPRIKQLVRQQASCKKIVLLLLFFWLWRPISYVFIVHRSLLSFIAKCVFSKIRKSSW